MHPAGIDDGRKKRPRFNVPRSLNDVIKDVERMERVLRKNIEIVDRLLRELYSLERALKGSGAANVGLGPGPNKPAPAGPLPAVQNFHFEVLGKGKAAVSFAEGNRVLLPPTLAELIIILNSNGDESPDELVAWKSIDRVGEMMQKRLGRAFSAHAISQLVWRLRGRLAEAGLDPRLVESSPTSGVRLRLKRQAAGLCAG